MAIVGISRTDRIGDNVNAMPFGQEIERRLLDANMTLDAAKNDLLALALRENFPEFRAQTATESLLFKHGPIFRTVFANRGDGGAQSLGVLLGETTVQFEDTGPAEQPSNVPCHFVGLGDGGKKSLLKIDHPQKGVLGGHQLGALRKRGRWCHEVLFSRRLGKSTLFTNTTIRRQKERYFSE
jgi:hypothetical protein